MRRLARIGCTLAGVALMAPAAALAQPPLPINEAPGVASTAPAQAPAPPRAPAAPKHRKGLFGREHLCASCQAAKAHKRDGVYVPVPPAPPATFSTKGSHCTTCGGSTVVAAFSRAPAAANRGQVVVQQGHGVAGGEGYAVVGPDPSPMGSVQPQLAGGGPARPGMGGLRDNAVMMSSMAEAPIKPPGANRPHVLSHLFGVSAIGRDWREERARHRGESHASIPYGQPTQPINELPAKVVYGR
jgi:hypothetical protein